MPKTIRNCFFKNLTFEKLMNAHLRARKNKTFKKDVILYELNLENNIVNLLNSIRTGTYKIGKYYDFKIFEPKERIIHSLPYKMGVDFCGYRTYTTHRLLRNNSKKKIKKKVKCWNKLYKNKKLNLRKTLNSLNAWREHASHCNTYNLQQKIYCF